MTLAETSGAVAELQNVSKSYGPVAALRDASLSVAPGETVALLGPNGAGKTTVINLLLGLRSPDGGTVRLFGRDPRSPSARRDIGATPQETAFPQHLRCREVIALVASHFARPLDTRTVIRRFALDDFADRQCGGLSGGQRRRLALALAFLGQGRAVFLDEPTTGLDAGVRRELWQIVRGYVAEGGTVFLTTHYLEEAEALADRVILIERGRVLLEGRVDEVRARVAQQQVSFRAGPLPDLAGVTAHERDGDRHRLLTADADALVRQLVTRDVAFRDLEVSRLSLEQAVLTLLERETDGSPGDAP